MFPINLASKASLIEKAARQLTEGSQLRKEGTEETEGELTHDNKQISNYYMYYYIGLEMNK